MGSRSKVNDMFTFGLHRSLSLASVKTRSEECQFRIVMTAPCRSYSAQAFDGCPNCLDEALDVVTLFGLSKLVGRFEFAIAPGRVPGT